MPLYEHVFMARQDVSSQQVDALVEQFKGVIEQNGGSIAKVENWGVKPLAYRIKKNRKAHYALMNIDAPPAAVSEMERQMRINEDVLRYLTIRVDEHEDVPSVMLQKRDRDDRRRRDRDDFGGGREFGGGRDFGGRGDRGDRRPRRDEDAGQETA
jgi:small subunit ribosomal protein S6